MYALSSTKNLYVMNKKSGKLESLLLVPFGKEEVSAMVTGKDSLVIYSGGELFKLESE